MNDLKS